MSELAPTVINQFAEIQQQEYSNGSHHLYGVNAEGKKTHISWGAVAMQYGVELGQPVPDKGDNWINDDPTPEISEDDKRWNNETRQGHMEALDDLRNGYLRRVAGRSRRALHAIGGEKSKAGVEKAQREYEEFRDGIFATELDYLRDDLGLDPEGVDQVMACFAFSEKRKLARTLHDLGLKATGNYKITEHTREAANGRNAAWTETEQVKKGPIGRAMNKFYGWFGSVDESSKLFSKKRLQKGGVMAGVGVVAGVALAPLAGFAAAGIGGGVLLNRISKAYMSTHIRRKSQEANDMHATKRLNELYNGLGDGSNGAAMTGLIAEQTAREVHLNRRRTALGLGALALGFAGGELVHHIAGNAGNHPAHSGPKVGDGSSKNGLEHGKLPLLHKPEVAKGHSHDFDLKQGHTIWGDTTDYATQHGVHLTDHQTYLAVNSILKQNHLSWEQARHLRAGYDWHVNQAVLEELAKDKVA